MPDVYTCNCLCHFPTGWHWKPGDPHPKVMVPCQECEMVSHGPWEPAPAPWATCVLCDEPIGHYDAWVQFNPSQLVHHACSIRSALGGIGHQLAHEWWCQQQHDPDAGLTYRQSAEMVKVLVELLGIDEVARRAVDT